MPVTTRQQHVQLDDVLLETTLYAADRLNDTSSNRLAVFLHPWSWLGGRMTDYVLQTLLPSFTDKGYDVLLFNSRGVGESSGRASFSGLAEAHDLELLVHWAIKELSSIQHVVLMGYSHGSLIASMHPSSIQFHSQDIPVHRILLSYPVSYRGFLTLFNTQKYKNALATLLSQPNHARTMMAYGTSDQFTSASKYHSWIQELRQYNSDHQSLTIREVEGADHFWHGPHATRLCDLVGAWLKELDS